LLKSGHSVAICVLFACPPHVNHIIKLEKYTIRFIKRQKYLRESGKILTKSDRGTQNALELYGINYIEFNRKRIFAVKNQKSKTPCHRRSGFLNGDHIEKKLAFTRTVACVREGVSFYQ